MTPTRYKELVEYLKRIVNLHPDENMTVSQVVEIIKGQRESRELMAYHAIAYMAEYIDSHRSHCEHQG